MQRVWSWGWLLLTLSVASAQSDADPLQQRVRFREPAQPVRQILQTLSRRAEIRFVAAPEVKDEIVLIDAENLSLRQVMDGLALALDAEWTPQPDGSYRLSRPVKRAQQRRARDDAHIVQFWREELKKRTPENLERPLTEAEVRATMRRLREMMQEALAQPDRQSRFDNLMNFYKPLEQISPLTRLLHRLLAQFDLRELTRIPINEQRVYSVRPGRYLLPFPKDAEPLVREFLREMAMVSSVYRDPTDGLADLVSRFEQQFGFDPVEYLLPPAAPKQLPQHEIYLQVVRQSELTLAIRLYIRRGEGVREADIMTDSVYLYQRGASLNLPEEIRWREQPIMWGELGRLQLRAFHEGEDAPSPESFQAINPAVVEPLSLAPSDVLRSYAHARGKPLIALIPENAISLYTGDDDAPLPNADAKLGALESYLARWEWVEGAVLVATPRFASYWWNRRYPRDGVNRIIERVKQRGYFNGDDYFLALQIASDPETLNYAGWWLTTNGVEAYSFDQPEALLMQAMGEGLWRRLLSGETLRVSDLPPPVLKQLHHMVYERAYGGVEVEISDAESWRLLPVFFYPNGIPPTMQVRLKKETKMGFFGTHRNGVWSDFKELSYAHLLTQWSEPPIDDYFYGRYFQRERRFLSGSPVQYATRIEYGLELIPPDETGAKLVIGLPDWYALIGKPTPWNQPPDEAKAAFEEVVKSEREGDY